MGLFREVTLHFIRQCFPNLFDKLHVSLSRGHVDSTDVLLSKSDPFSVLGLPWQIVDGKVSGLSLQLPWMNHLAANFSVVVKSVYIRLAEVPFPALQDGVFRALKDAERREKFRLVVQVERNQAPIGTSVRLMVAQVLGRIELHVENVTAEIDFANGYVGTFRIAKLLARRPTGSAAHSSRALVVSVEGISAVIKSPSSALAIPVDIHDFSLHLALELDGGNLNINLDLSQIVEVSLNSCFPEFLHSLNLRQRQWWSAYTLCRPSSSAQTDVTSWMRYAYRAVVAYHGLSRVQFSLNHLRQTFRSFVEYKNLQVKRLKGSKLKTEEIDRISELENLFDVELLVLLRHAAKRDAAAGEVSAFGTSEWLRWLFFGHKMSFERERLTADIKKSLERSREGSEEDNLRKGNDRNQSYVEKYIFQCKLNWLSLRVGDGMHELKLSLMRLGLSAERNPDKGLYRIELSLEDLLLFLDRSKVGHKKHRPIAETSESLDTALITARFTNFGEGTSSNISLRSWHAVIHADITENFRSLVRRWVSLPASVNFEPLVHVWHQQARGHGLRNLSILFANTTFSVSNVSFVFLDDKVEHRGRSPAFMLILQQVSTRLPSSRTSSIPEVEAALCLQGLEFDGPLKSTEFTGPDVSDTSFPNSDHQFFAVSTRFGIAWTPTTTVKCSNVNGFIHAPAAVRALTMLRASFNSSAMNNTLSRMYDTSGNPTSIDVGDDLSIQERFLRHETQLIVSSLRANILWDSQASHRMVTVDCKNCETSLSSLRFIVLSLRVGSLDVSSRTPCSSLLIEASSHFQHSIYVKRLANPKVSGHCFEVLMGDICAQVCPDMVLALNGLLSGVRDASNYASSKGRALSSNETVQKVAEGHVSKVSLLSPSLRLGWSDEPFHAEMNCSSIHITAEGTKVSGAVETVTLMKLHSTTDTLSPASEVILRVTDSIRPSSAAFRFLCNSNAIHIDLQNLTAFVERSFWDPLVLSIVHMLEELERKDSKTLSELDSRQNDDDSLPITIKGSWLIVVIPISTPLLSPIYLDVTSTIIDLKTGFHRLSFGRTAMGIKDQLEDCQTLQSKESEVRTQILPFTDFVLQHTNKLSEVESTNTVHYSDAWELEAPNAVAISLSPKSAASLWTAVCELLSPWNERSSPGESRSQTDICAVPPSSIVERFRTLFRCSIPSLRLRIGFDPSDANTEPLAVVDVSSIRISTVQAQDKVFIPDCNVMVSTWLVSCHALQLIKSHVRSPQTLRIALGADLRGGSHKYLPHRHQAVSFRVVSRYDHSQHTLTCDVLASGVYVLHDPELYLKISEFVRRCFGEVGSNQDTNGMQTRDRNEHHGDHSKFNPSLTDEISPKGSALLRSRTLASDQASSKFAMKLTEITLMFLLNEAHDSIRCINLHIQKLSTELLLSNRIRPTNGSTARLEGISLGIYTNSESTGGPLGSTSEDGGLENAMSANQVWSNRNLDYSYSTDPPFSIVSPRNPGCRKENLTIAVRGVCATLRHSNEDELVLSIGKVLLNASLEKVIHLAPLLSFKRTNAPIGMPNIFDESFAPPAAFRMYVQSICFGLMTNVSPKHTGNGSKSRSGMMRIDANVSGFGIVKGKFEVLEGTIKVSADIADDASGHRDQLLSPCSIQYEVKRKRACIVQLDVKTLLRISFSPLTVKMASLVTAALQKWNLDAVRSDAPLPYQDMDAKLYVRIRGISMRCLADTPRIQVLRLLLGDVKLDTVFVFATGSRVADLSVQELLLEDTISWRLFRSDPADSTSRRWERIVASIRVTQDRAGSRSSASDEDLHTSESYLATTRLPAQKFGSRSSLALRFHLTWYNNFDDFKARIDSSGLEVNLDLVALPVILEWCKTLVDQPFPKNDGSSRPKTRCTQPLTTETPGIMQRESWISDIRLEPLIVIGGIRAAPRRLQESIYERVLTSMLDVDAVTGIALQLPAVRIQQRQSFTAVVHQALSTYALAAMSRQFLSQILMQSGRLARLFRVLAVSAFRQRPYNLLWQSPKDTAATDESRRPVASALLSIAEAMDRKFGFVSNFLEGAARPISTDGTQQVVGLLGVLSSAEETPRSISNSSSSSNMALVIDRTTLPDSHRLVERHDFQKRLAERVQAGSSSEHTIDLT